MHYGFFDGATAGQNPGPIGIGFCIYQDKKEIAIGAGPWLLECAVELGIKEITILGDSQLIIRQVNGVWKASDKFENVLTSINELIKHFDFIAFEWVPRGKNQRADALSKRGLALEDKKIYIKSGAKVDSHTPSPACGVSGALSKKQSGDDIDAHQLSTEVRVGKKYAVIIDSGGNQFLIDFRLGRCSCGVQNCEHFGLIGWEDGQLKSA